jgi:biotin synthase-like enzyme
MQKLDKKEIFEIIENIYDICKNIESIVGIGVNNLDDCEQIATLYDNKGLLINKLIEMKDSEPWAKVFSDNIEEISKEMRKVDDIDSKLISSIGALKDEMAQKLRKFNSDKLVLAYKKA